MQRDTSTGVVQCGGERGTPSKEEMRVNKRAKGWDEEGEAVVVGQKEQ